MPAPTIKIFQGDARARLRELPEESVHAVVTSPPYFGLRSYKTEPQIWDGREGCDHRWDEPTGLSRAGRDDAYWGGKQASDSKVKRGPQPSVRCSICGSWKGELGLEPSVNLYISHLVEVFESVRRVLRSDGTLWVIIGDSYCGNGGTRRDAGREGQPQEGSEVYRKWDRDYAGLEPKNLLGVPYRLAFAMQEAGWIWRAKVTWVKGASLGPYSGSVMPESVNDRPSRSHEEILMFAKSNETTFWTHRDGRGTRSPPDPDYVWQELDPETGEKTGHEVREPPKAWSRWYESTREGRPPQRSTGWTRINLWDGHDYFYDADALQRLPICHNGAEDHDRAPRGEKRTGAQRQGVDPAERALIPYEFAKALTLAIEATAEGAL